MSNCLLKFCLLEAPPVPSCSEKVCRINQLWFYKSQGQAQKLSVADRWSPCELSINDFPALSKALQGRQCHHLIAQVFLLPALGLLTYSVSPWTPVDLKLTLKVRWVDFLLQVHKPFSKNLRDQCVQKYGVFRRKLRTHIHMSIPPEGLDFSTS